MPTNKSFIAGSSYRKIGKSLIGTTERNANRSQNKLLQGSRLSCGRIHRNMFVRAVMGTVC